MATYEAIYGVGTAIKSLLEDNYPKAWGTPVVTVVHPTEISSTTVSGKTGFTVSLYRVSVSGTQRLQTPRKDEKGKLFHPSRLVDLHYIITPWAMSPDAQHRMLGWLITLIEEYGAIPGAVLNRNLADPQTFGALETVQLTFESLPLTEYFNLWDKLRNGFPPSVTCVARMVALDSMLAIEEGEPVRTRKFVAYQAGAI